MALDLEKRNELKEWVRRAEGLDTEQKSALLGLLNENKRYGLVWEDKPEDAQELLRKQWPVLKEVEERRIQGASPSSPGHILIEGDNLHALSALQYTHAGKVDVIYIDPPYNTGNKDFVYNDDYVDREDAWRHSKWLSFMEKRLKLAKNLLKETGVIFISIDDNELGQLKILSDEVFGSENFVDFFSWVKTSTPPGLANKSRKTVEYILCYEKQSSNREFYGELLDGGDAPLLNAGNKKRTLVLPPAAVEFRIPDGLYKAGKYDRIVLEYDIQIHDGKAIAPIQITGEFKWTQETVDFEIKEGTYFLIKSEKFSIRFQRKNEGLYKAPTNRIKEQYTRTTIDREEEVGTNETASKELENLIGKGVFSFPKPTSLIKYLLGFPGNPNALILDFFAGSGTTLHATMALNAEDGGKRQCILVTNNENGICENVTYERNKRVIQGYTNAKGQAVPGLVDNTLRYYRVEFVERLNGQKQRRLLASSLKDLLCIKEGCYTPHPSIKIDGCSAFASAAYLLFLVENPDAVEGVVECIASQDKPCKVFVYSPDADPFTVDFEEVQDRVELYALPEAYYQALRQCLPEAEL